MPNSPRSSGRRAAALALTVVLVVPIAGCGGDDDAASPTPTSPSTEPTVTPTGPTPTDVPMTTTPTDVPVTPTPTVGVSPTPFPSVPFTSELLRATIDLPETWERDLGYGDEAFFGDDGFLIVTTIGSGANLDGVAAGEVEHPLRPYGSDPAISPIVVGGVEGRMIQPGSDAPVVVAGFRQAAVIVPLDASGTYGALYGDPVHLVEIATSLRWDG